MKYTVQFLFFLLLLTVKSYASPFSYPIDAYSLDESLHSRLNKKNLSIEDKVFVKQGHFYTYGIDEKPATEDDVRIKFWGINLAPPLTFPESKEKARELAKSISNLGFNLVRILGLDKFPVSEQYLTLLERDAKNPLISFNPENEAGLKRLLSALSEEGVYISLVLKSGYTYDSTRNCRKEGDRAVCVPDAAEKITGFDGPSKPAKGSKHIDIFNSEIREHLKLYTDHIVGVIKQFPNIAMLELNNENSLIELFRKPKDFLPPVYTLELNDKWNNWLSEKYGSYGNMLSVWNKKAPPYLESDYSYSKGKSNGWMIRELKQDAHLNKYKFKRRNVNLIAGGVYSVSVVADRKDISSVKINLLGNNKRVNTGKVQKTVVGSNSVNLCLRSSETVKHGIIDISVLAENKPSAIIITQAQSSDPANLITSKYDLSDKITGVQAVKLTDDGSCLYPDRVYEDYLTFLHDVEDQYYDEMVQYVKSLIDVPVNTTQSKYGGLLGQAIQIKHSDFMTSHFYWDHPSIPSNNQNNWTMRNHSFVNNLDKFIGKLFSYPLIDGMPTVVSEFNVNHANQFSAGGYLTAAAYANFQDVDGLVLFTYYRSGGDSRKNIQNKRLAHWYSIIGDSRFSSLSLTASNLFRRTDNKVAEKVEFLTVAERSKPLYWGYPIRNINKQLQLEEVTGSDKLFDLSMPITNRFRLTSDPSKHIAMGSDDKDINSKTKELVWNGNNNIIIDTPKTQAVVGKIASSMNMTDVVVHTDESYQHGVVAISSLSSDDIVDSKEILITLVSEGKNENTELLKVNKRYRLCVKKGAHCVDDFWSKAAGDFKVRSMKLNLRIKNSMAKAMLHTLNSEGLSIRSKEIEPVEGVYNIELDGDKDSVLWYKIKEL